MEQNQISLERLAKRLYELEAEVRELKQQKTTQIDDDWSNICVLADENLLAEAWLSPEDEEAWKDL